MDIIKAFESNNATQHITIRGTHEEPLFRASDIGEVLEMTNIRQSIQDFDHTEKQGVSIAYTLGGPQETTFLTEKGLYKLLFKSRKPIAKQFTDWVCEVIKEIRLNGKYELEKALYDSKEQLKSKDKETEKTLVDSFDNKQVLYLIQIKNDVIKFGHTNDIKRRITEHRTNYGSQIIIKMIYESKYNRELEQMIKITLKKYLIDDKMELIRLSDNFTYENLIKEIELLKKEINNDTIPHLIKELISDSTKELSKEINKLKTELEVYKNNEHVKKFDKLLETNKVLHKIKTERDVLRKMTNQNISTQEELKHIPITENIYEDFIKKRLIVGPEYRCALSQLCADFHKWSNNNTIFINGRYKVKFKKELMDNITKITNIQHISGMNITNKSKGIRLTKCIGYEGIGIKEVENNYVHMYEDKIYDEFINEKIIVTNIQKDKITSREILDNFILWLTNKNYEINKDSLGKSLYSEIFVSEFVNFITKKLNIIYVLKGRKKYNNIKCTGYFIGIKLIT